MCLTKCIAIFMELFLNSLFARKTSEGFTLIELLVVIGILGILAASLVAAINPFEQLKKANDANVKNTLVEYIDANIRYYTTHNAMPWNDTAAASACNGGSIPTSQVLGATNMSGCLYDLVNDGEIQTGFTTVTNILGSIYVNGGSNSLTACFQPSSSAELHDPQTKYNANGTPATGCSSQTSSGSSCYWCSQ